MISLNLTPAEQIRRVWDVLEIKNLMARRAYYNSFRLYRQTMEELWVTSPQRRADASYGQNGGYQIGYDGIFENMVILAEQRQAERLRAFRQADPSIIPAEENLGIGEMEMHPLTTPLVEVAEDGLTAKGMWYCPSSATVSAPDGTICAQWIYERIGVDFVKEDGRWKIWHLFCGTDITQTPGTDRAEEDIRDLPLVPAPDSGIQLSQAYQAYTPQYNWSAYPPVPWPHKSFDPADSYGPEGNPAGKEDEHE